MDFDLAKPHDHLFRAILSDPGRAQAVLQAHLEPWLRRQLSAGPPVPLDGSFVDEELRSSQCDKLFQVTLKDGQPAFVYVLLEHKSHSDAGTALQVWKYKLRIWNKYAEGRADRFRRLPPIIPLVFYHGSEPWTAPESVADMLATGDERVRALEPSFGYYLRHLGDIPIRRLAPDPSARAGLIALRYSHKGGKADRLRILPEVVAALPDGSEYEAQVLVYLMGVWRVRETTLRVVAEQAKPGRGEAVVGQVVQELLDRGEARGLVRGEARGLARTLTRLLEHRFGPLPSAVVSRISVASSEELNARFMALLDAQSLSQVFPELDWD